MHEETSSDNSTDPDIFSRGGLKLTYELTRKENPQLALDVRNIIGGETPARQSVRTGK